MKACRRVDSKLNAFVDMLTLLGKTITSTIQDNTITIVDIPGCVDIFMEGKLPIDRLITRTFKLEKINEAFKAMEKGEVSRSVIKM